MDLAHDFWVRSGECGGGGGQRRERERTAVEVSSEELTVKVPRRYLSLRQVQQRRQKLFSLPAAGLQQQQQAPPSSAATATCRELLNC